MAGAGDDREPELTDETPPGQHYAGWRRLLFVQEFMFVFPVGGKVMAIGWLTVLKIVPWVEVISNAPKVVDGAKKLWNAVTKKSSASEGFQAVAEIEPQVMASLEARASALEAAVTDLHGQMVASSELIKALADQNAQLIQRIETNRVRLLWLSAATAVAATAALLGLLLVFWYHGA